MTKDFRIIFMGTPDFAVESLKRLTEAGMHVAAVVTAPDKPAGRGRKLKATPVKEFARQAQIPVLQPTNLKSAEFRETLAAYQPDLNVVVAFRMLPEVIWKLPTYHTINLHASLLPDYRGAAPINHVIINGEKETGVTTFFIDKRIDSGAIIDQERVPIGQDETAGELHDKLMKKGADLLLQTVQKIEQGTVQPLGQESLIKSGQTLRQAPKIQKQDCRIKWDEPAEKVRNLIHGLSPFPGAFTKLRHKTENKRYTLKIYRVDLTTTHTEATPGTLFTDGKTYIRISCRDRILEIKELQMEGRKRMSAEAFLRGISLVDFEIDWYE